MTGEEKDELISSMLENQDELLDEKYMRVILNAMRRIPFDVLDTIASDRYVRFSILAKLDYAVTKHIFDPFGAYPPEAIRPAVNWQVVMINDTTMSKLNPENKQAVIAHELAHIYLQHGDNTSHEKTHEDMEQEANQLIATWGFKPTIKPLRVKN